MRRCSIDKIKGGEILAEPVMTDRYQILLAEGVALQKEYIEKFKELGITEVCIREEEKTTETEVTEEVMAARTELQNKLKDQVKNVLERHIYQENKELQKLGDAAEAIIDEILQEENVVEEIIEIKDRSADLYEHAIRCCALSAVIGLRLGYSQESLHAIGVGCLLHDIGLRFISVNYENLDLDEMPENQKQEYKKHSVYGYSSLEKETWLDEISKKIILFHHESADGTGYPFHSKVIPKEVALVTVCDTFDEMVSGIGYRRKKIYKVIEYLKTFKKIKFNDRIVDEFLKAVAFYPVGSQIILNTGEVGEVIGQNRGFPERPKLRVISTKDGTNMDGTYVLNLLEKNSVFIEDVIN